MYLQIHQCSIKQLLWACIVILLHTDVFLTATSITGQPQMQHESWDKDSILTVLKEVTKLELTCQCDQPCCGIQVPVQKK